MSPIAQKTLFDLTQDGLVIGNKLKPLYPDFDVSAFVSDVREEMQNQTIYNVTNAIGKVLRHHLPQNYHEALSILIEYVKIESSTTSSKNTSTEVELSLRPISHFLSLYGLEDITASLNAFGELSKYRCTRGGQIREFIIQHPEECFSQFGEWIKDENPNLRLFVAAALCMRGTCQKWLRPYISDPQPILNILDQLYTDPDERVRELVAKDMRDIIKEFPEIGYTTLKKWKQDSSKETQKLIRQALKYQLKVGDERAYKLLDLEVPSKLGKPNIKLIALKCKQNPHPINKPFQFYFSYTNESEDDQIILTYYIICYKRLTGHITRKRYRLSQRKLKPKQQADYEKSLFPLPSLKQYHDGKAGLGWHRLELEINGEVIDGFDFDVVAPIKR